MSHECPECGQLCFCGGDVDDCMNNFELDVINCQHWRKCENEPNDDDDYDEVEVKQ